MDKQRILDQARTSDALIEIFTLLLYAGDGNRNEAAEQIRKLDATGKRDLRSAAARIDDLLDDVILEMRQRK